MFHEPDEQALDREPWLAYASILNPDVGEEDGSQTDGHPKKGGVVGLGRTVAVHSLHP